MPFVQAQNKKVEPFKGVTNVDVRDSKADWVLTSVKKHPKVHPTFFLSFTMIPALEPGHPTVGE